MSQSIMHCHKPFVTVIFFGAILIFVVGSYLAANSAVTLLRTADEWPTVQNFSWSVSDLVQGDKETMVKSPNGSRPSKDVTRQMGRGAQMTDSSSKVEPVIFPHKGRSYSPKWSSTLRESIQKVLSQLDPELQVQYILQAKKYEKQHSESIHQLTVALQWDFLVKFLEAVGYTQRFPDFINIGVKKSGTNALGFFISQHPLISHSIGNEVHFFDWNYEKGLDYYRSKMGFSSKFQLSFEKTPRYFVTDSAPGNILKDLGNATKFILMVRDPISRLKSDFRHERELGLRRTRSKNTRKRVATSPEAEGKMLTSLILDGQGNINSSSDVVRTSSYSVHLKNWLKYYPLSSFLFLDHDELISDTFSVVKKVEKFLNIGDYFKRNMFFFDPSRGGPCMVAGESPCPPKSTPGFLAKAKLSKNVESKLTQYFRPIIKDFVDITGGDFPWAKKYL